MPDIKTYRILAGLAAVVIVIAAVFLAIRYCWRGTGDGAPDSENIPYSNDPTRLEQAFLSEKIGDYKLSIPEPSYENATIKTGHVFLYGRYLPPPYKVEIARNYFLLNGIPLDPRQAKDRNPGPKSTPSTRKLGINLIIIMDMMKKTDFHNKSEVEELVKKVKELDGVENVVPSKIPGSPCLEVKFKDDIGWWGIDAWPMPPGAERAKYFEPIINEKKSVENCLGKGKVLFWFSGGKFWEDRWLGEKIVSKVVAEIDEILRDTMPRPEQTARDFTRQRDQLKKLLPSLTHTEIMEIIANWKRK